MASRTRRIALAMLLICGVAAPIIFGPDASAARSKAGIVVIHGDTGVEEECVKFAGRSIAAIDALTRTDFSMYTRTFQGLGRAVCALDGEGDASDNCFDAATGKYWQLFVKHHRKPIKEGEGASFDVLKDRSVYYLKFDSAFPPITPERVSFKSICG